MDGLPITAEQFAALPAEFRAILQAIIAHYERRIGLLEARVVELEAELAAAKKNPRNSSKPPSSEHPHAKPKPKAPPSGRRPGGQPGHEKHQRALIPVEDCVAVHDHKPTTCGGCGKSLRGAAPDATPLRKQILEIPPIMPDVTEHRLHRLTCPGCGATTCGALPPDVPTIEAGPRLVALAALLMADFRCSKRKAAAFLQDVLNVPCSPGWVVKLQNFATGALRPAYDDLVARLPDEPRLNIDETPTKQAKLKAWLWTFVAATFTVFSLRKSRKADALHDHLGENFAGVVGCDRAKMYFSIDKVQWCWAHLIRDFQSWIDGPDATAKRLGHDLMRPITRLFELWWNVRDGTLTREEFREQSQHDRDEIDSLLLRGVHLATGKPRATCVELRRHRARLWAFAEHDGVEPTNNAAERALRQAVIWRKLSFGTQSAAGSRFVETMLTIIETCRQQGRSAYAFAIEALTARHAGKPAPTLTGA